MEMTAASSDSHGKDVHMLREKRRNLNCSTGCTQNACGLRLKDKPGLKMKYFSKWNNGVLEVKPCAL